MKKLLWLAAFALLAFAATEPRFKPFRVIPVWTNGPSVRPIAEWEPMPRCDVFQYSYGKGLWRDGHATNLTTARDLVADPRQGYAPAYRIKRTHWGHVTFFVRPGQEDW